MEESNQDLNQQPVQNPPSEQVTTAPQIDSTSNKPKSKLPMIIAGVVIILLLVGAVSVVLFFKKSTSPEEQAKTTITPQPTVLQTTIIPSATSLVPTLDTTSWINFPQQDSYGFTFKYDANKYEQWKTSPYDLAWVSKGQDGKDVPDSIMLKCQKTVPTEYPEKINSKNIKLGDKDAIYYQISDIQSGNKYALVDFVATPGNCRLYKNITPVGESEEFDTIISTFRFL